MKIREIVALSKLMAELSLHSTRLSWHVVHDSPTIPPLPHEGVYLRQLAKL